MSLNWITIIKVVGIYELTAAILFVYGDCFGSFLALLNKIIALTFTYFTIFSKGFDLSHISLENRLKLSEALILLGVVMTLMASF